MTAPAFQYFGAKARSAHRILRLVRPGHWTWVEGFAGSAAVTLAKPRHRDEHLNDLNGQIVNLFRVLRDDDMRLRLCQLVELTPYAQSEYEDAVTTSPTGDLVEDARRFMVRTWQGFQGAGWGATGWKSLDSSNKSRALVWLDVPARIRAVAERLRGVVIHQRDIMEIVQKFGPRPDTVLFLDPPYPAGSHNSRCQTYAVNMTNEQHAELARALVAARCDVIMTMGQGTLYDDALADWHRTPLPVRGLRNTVKDEVIFTNYQPPADLFGGAA